MRAILAAAAFTAWALPPGVDPDVADMVETIVEEQGGAMLAESMVADLIGEPVASAAGRPRLAGLLPVLVLRMTLVFPSRGKGLRWDVVVCLVWPLG